MFDRCISTNSQPIIHSTRFLHFIVPMNNQDKPSFFAILPATVRYDERLKPIERIFFAEITALSNKYGYATASNGYFQKLYKVSKTTVSRYISNLVRLGYVRSEIERDENKQIISRRLYPMMDEHSKLTIPIDQTSNRPIDQTSNSPIAQTSKENNTSILNNTSNNNITLEGTRHFDNPLSFLKYFIVVEDNKRFEEKLSKLKSLELLLNDFKAHFEEKQMSFDNSNKSKKGLLKYFDLYLDICIAQSKEVATTPQNGTNNVFNDCKTYFENTFNQVATEHELKYELPAILNSIKKTIELKNKKQGHTNFAASTEQKVDLFKQICDNLPEFYQDKVSLKTIANNYNSILSQVKKTVHKEEAIEDKLKSLRSFYNNNPKLMHRVRINAQVSDQTLVTMIKDFVQQCTDFYTMTQEQTHNELITFLRKSSLAGHKKYNLTIKDEQAKQRILKQTIKS